MGVAKNLGQLRKDLIANRGSVISQLRRLMREFVAMLHEATQLRCRWRWRCSPSDQLHFIGHLGTQLQLRGEPIGQAEGIPLVGLEHPFGPLLHMDALDGNIQLQQILLEICVIVPGVLKQDRDLFEGRVLPNAVDKGTKAVA
jgi:hypothetical protein